MCFLITQSLLASWQYQWKDFDKYGDSGDELREKAYNEFLCALRRESIPTNESMQKGIELENLVMNITFGKGDCSHKWYDVAKEIAEEVQNGQFQIAAKKTVKIEGLDFLLYGKLDCLKAGIISDIKFSGKYETGKFFKSPQHPMYMELVPEAERFTYIVTNGVRVWRETYHRDECHSILDTICEFISYLDTYKLLSVYKEFWRAKW